MIKSWKNAVAKEVFEGLAPKAFPADLVKKARRVLVQLDAAATVEDMRSPPGNRLHKLSGNLAGAWSVSVNMKFRVTFVWGAEGPEDVWLGDYH